MAQQSQDSREFALTLAFARIEALIDLKHVCETCTSWNSAATEALWSALCDERWGPQLRLLRALPPCRHRSLRQLARQRATADRAAVGAARAAAVPAAIAAANRSDYMLGIEVTSNAERLPPGLLLVNGLGELARPVNNTHDRTLGTVDWSATFEPGSPFMTALRGAEAAELERLQRSDTEMVSRHIECQEDRVGAACELRINEMMQRFCPKLGGRGDHDGWTQDTRVYLVRKSDGKVVTLTRDAQVAISEYSDVQRGGKIFGTGRPSPFRLGLIELHEVKRELVDESAREKVVASNTVHAAVYALANEAERRARQHGLGTEPYVREMPGWSKGCADDTGTHLEHVGATFEEIAARIEEMNRDPSAHRYARDRISCGEGPVPVPDDMLRELLHISYLFEQEGQPTGGEEQTVRFSARHFPRRFSKPFTEPFTWQPPATAYKYTASVRLLKQRTNPSWETRAAPPAEQILTTEELMHVVSMQCQ